MDLFSKCYPCKVIIGTGSTGNNQPSKNKNPSNVTLTNAIAIFEHFFGLIEHDSAELPSKAAVQSCSIAALLKNFAKFTGNHQRCSTSFLAN